MPGQIRVGFAAPVSVPTQNVPHRVCLIKTMFEQKPRTGPKMGTRTFGDLANRAEPI